MFSVLSPLSARRSGSEAPHLHGVYQVYSELVCEEPWRFDAFVRVGSGEKNSKLVGRCVSGVSPGEQTRTRTSLV